MFKIFEFFEGKNLVEHTMELSSIISGLQPNTSYEIHVSVSHISLYSTTA